MPSWAEALEWKQPLESESERLQGRGWEGAILPWQAAARKQSLPLELLPTDGNRRLGQEGARGSSRDGYPSLALQGDWQSPEVPSRDNCHPAPGLKGGLGGSSARPSFARLWGELPSLWAGKN